MNEIEHFYELIRRLSRSVDGAIRLTDGGRDHNWPARGVYFFFEQGETRPDRENEPRVVRIGTHGLKLGSSSTLYGRLSQHRGTRSGGGNHRGSVFRLHVGKALIRRGRINCPSWAKGSNAPREVRVAELPTEELVSEHIGNMEVLWLNIPDEPGPDSLRGYIERNAIGLLAGKEPASSNWLGRLSGNERIVRSHLWNVNHVDHWPDKNFLSTLESVICEMTKRV